jgi:hypothetical protein
VVRARRRRRARAGGTARDPSRGHGRDPRA